MKKVLILTAALVMLSTVIIFAQTSDAEADAMVTLLGVQKREAMHQLVMVSKKDSVACWQLYDEY